MTATGKQGSCYPHDDHCKNCNIYIYIILHFYVNIFTSKYCNIFQHVKKNMLELDQSFFKIGVEKIQQQRKNTHTQNTNLKIIK